MILSVRYYEGKVSDNMHRAFDSLLLPVCMQPDKPVYHQCPEGRWCEH